MTFTINSLQWLQSLQLTDSFFPLGAFSYSDGLEAAVDQKIVVNGKSLEEWIRNWIDQCFFHCDGRALLLARNSWEAKDWDRFQQIDQELTAIKPSLTIRNSSTSLGKRLLHSCIPLYPNQGLEEVMKKIEKGVLNGNAPLIYSVLFSIMGLADRESLLCYAYTRLSGMISAALRLISMGQQEGQQILTRQLNTIPSVVEEILQPGEEQISSFSPVVDLCQMNHRYLYTRLFRS